MKRKATLLRMPEELFDAITRQAEKQGRNEMLCEILYEHFKDKIVPIQCKATPNIPGMIEHEKQETVLESNMPQKNTPCNEGVSDA